MKTSSIELNAVAKADKPAQAIPLDAQIRQINAGLVYGIKDSFLSQDFCEKTLAAHLDCLVQAEKSTQWIDRITHGESDIAEVSSQLSKAISQIGEPASRPNSDYLDCLSYTLKLEYLHQNQRYCGTFSLLDVSLSHLKFVLIDAPDRLSKRPSWVSFLVQDTFAEFSKRTAHLGSFDFHQSPSEVMDGLLQHKFEYSDIFEEIAILLKSSKNQSFDLAWEVIQLACEQFEPDYLLEYFPTLNYDCEKKDFDKLNSQADVDIFLNEVKFRCLDPDCFTNPALLGQTFLPNKSTEQRRKMALKSLKEHDCALNAYQQFQHCSQHVQALAEQSIYLQFLQNNDYESARQSRQAIVNEWNDCDLNNIAALHFVLVSHTDQSNGFRDAELANQYLNRVVQNCSLDIGNTRLFCSHKPVCEDIYSEEDCYLPIEIPMSVKDEKEQSRALQSIYEFYSEREIFKQLVKAHREMAQCLQAFYDELRSIVD